MGAGKPTVLKEMLIFHLFESHRVPHQRYFHHWPGELYDHVRNKEIPCILTLESGDVNKTSKGGGGAYHLGSNW